MVRVRKIWCNLRNCELPEQREPLRFSLEDAEFLVGVVGTFSFCYLSYLCYSHKLYFFTKAFYI